MVIAPPESPGLLGKAPEHSLVPLRAHQIHTPDTNISEENASQGLPRWSSGAGSMLPEQEVWVPALLRELDPACHK